MSALPLAPAMSDKREWLNAPATNLEQQRRRVVVLGFWHAGSVFCQNLLDDLRFVQGKHADGVSVLGIHTPKFDAERSARVVHKAINRFGVRFPVANDPGFEAWQH